MKKVQKYLFGAMCIAALGISAGTFMKVNAASEAVTISGQPVDLTYAAEKALPSVVYIKNTQNSKVQTVEYSDPFEDFFSDPFGGFFGRGAGRGPGRAS